MGYFAAHQRFKADYGRDPTDVETLALARALPGLSWEYRDGKYHAVDDDGSAYAIGPWPGSSLWGWTATHPETVREPRTNGGASACAEQAMDTIAKYSREVKAEQPTPPRPDSRTRYRSIDDQ